jgi:transcriptional regulator with XRE-family HTH domain
MKTANNGKLTRFGKLVVKALTDQDMSKTQLAAEIGTSPQYLSYILYGVRSGEKYLPLIIAALDLDPRKVEKAMAA